jgi:arsenate reductase-like glutaredoxin family protein
MSVTELKRLIKDLTDNQKVKLAAHTLSEVEPTKDNLDKFLNSLNESTFGELDGWFSKEGNS